jgi:serine/threonine-protein kinase RsbW
MRDETAGDDRLGAGGGLPEGGEGAADVGADLMGRTTLEDTALTQPARPTVAVGAEPAGREPVPSDQVRDDPAAPGPTSPGPASPDSTPQSPAPQSPAATDPGGLLPDSEVFIEIPGDRLYVVLARSAAVHLGSVLQLGVTDVTDLRLAVDEACALFLLHPAFPDGRDTGLACRFAAYRDELRVTVRAAVPAGFAPDTEAIGWIMLGALVDDLAWTRQDGYGTLTLTKRIMPPTTP